MLTAVLCHYERSNNCLYKETVVRMDSVTLNQAKGLSWVKAGLGIIGEVGVMKVYLVLGILDLRKKGHRSNVYLSGYGSFYRLHFSRKF